MKQIALPSEAREIDKKMMLDKKIPGLLLMEQAAVAIFRTVERLDLSSRRVLVVAGGGKQRRRCFCRRPHSAHKRLRRASWLCACKGTSRRCSNELRLFEHSGRLTLLDERTLSSFFAFPSEVILDGLFGIGLNREPAGIYAKSNCGNQRTFRL